MKTIALLFVACFFVAVSLAQPADAKQLYESAQAFMRQGDYANAALVLNRALQQEPKNTAMGKDLAQSYYYQGDNGKALATIKPLLDRDDADDQCYQIAGMVYKSMEDPESAEKMYKKGIKKFPDSGPLYNEYGEMLSGLQNPIAIKEWEKGIEMDPSYSKNYYNACRFYFDNGNNMWSILYAETFVNMEPMSSKTPQIKSMLLESYKRLFAETDLTKNNPPPSGKGKISFTDAYLQTMNKQSAVATNGINPETLTMIRTRFILDWYADFGNKFPYKQFELQRQLLQEGLFDAYNQWIFGPTQNLAAYQNWTSTHAAEYGEFSRFQKGRVFRIPAGQYYQTK